MLNQTKTMLASIGLAAVAFGLSLSTAQAVTVTSTNSAVFSFDISSWPDLTGTNVNFGQYGTPVICVHTPGPCLATGASIQWDFGTTAGASNLGVVSTTNSGPPTSGFTGGIFSPPVFVPASLSTV